MLLQRPTLQSPARKPSLSKLRKKIAVHEAFDTGDELREPLRGLRAVTYVDSVAMKRPAPNLYGSMIAWTGLYRVDAEVESYWSVAFTRDGSIVSIERE